MLRLVDWTFRRSIQSYTTMSLDHHRHVLYYAVPYCTALYCTALHWSKFTLLYCTLCTKLLDSTNPFCFLLFLLFSSYLFIGSPLQSAFPLSFPSPFPTPSIILLLPIPPPPHHHPSFLSTSPSLLIFFSIILP